MANRSLLAEGFGRHLRNHRQRANLSDREIAVRTGLQRADIHAVEAGERLPRLDTILKLSAAVEATPCDLMAGLRWHPGYYVEGGFAVEDRSAAASDVKPSEGSP